VTERFQCKSTGCRNAEGEILTDGNDMINRWKEYFQDLYEGTQDMEGLPEWLPMREHNREEDRPPTTEDFVQAIKKAEK
jgi:hypothetical protein